MTTALVLAVVVLGGWVFWLSWDRAHMADRCDEALDLADQAARGLDEVRDYLFGIEKPSTGRHASRRAA